LSYYAKALADGDCFRKISWSGEYLAHVQSVPKSPFHCFWIGQDVDIHSLQGEAGKKYNGKRGKVLNTIHPFVKEKLVVIVAGAKLGIRPEKLRVVV
jgi:hypothetical protein